MAAIREHYPDAICRISCYPPPTVGISEPWSAPSADEFNAWCGTRAPYLATVMDTWRPPFTGDFILHLDADTLPIGPFDELFDTRAICGMQAHHAPYQVSGWLQIFTLAGLPTPRMDTQYSGHGIMFHDEVERFGPFYPNSGMIFGPRDLFETIAAPFFDAIRFLRSTIRDAYWYDQIAACLAIARTGVPVRALALRYNFPNRRAFELAAHSELCEARFLHLMDTADGLDRDRDFASSEALDRLIARSQHSKVNEKARRRVAELRAAAGV